MNNNIQYLDEVLIKLPDEFRFKGDYYIMDFYSISEYKGRSEEIIYKNTDNTKEIYILEDSIELLELVK
jgi:hypothetical protein